ncbi:MAG: VUT family protein [Paracoccus sp. (in: a-proteobacteria)]|uniref:VUT family protein n=1 Tax=Paracoccus sp. TaxID=267 RepID=UPI0026DEC167|nr:VUT family protein [Paracoccus sp. (in: a-proteobacteria)]MDO5621719.1 VUT family protein [Paracoccus sp. (in: a-proteobacteria)]
MTRFLPGILAMAAVVLASNILVQFHLGNFITGGTLTYPLAFLVTDVMNRVYGASAARRVVLAGFIFGVIASLVAAGFGQTTLRIAIASGTAFLIAQLTDVAVFDRLRARAKWWQAPLTSSVVGSALDTALFFSIAFSTTFAFIDPAADTAWATEMVPLLDFGPSAPFWASLGLADWLVKMAMAALSLVPFRMIVQYLTTPRQAA